MNYPLIFNRNKLELIITIILFFYYLGINIPEALTKTWAVFGFLTIPLLVIWNYKRFLWVISRDILLLLLIAVVPLSFLWSVSPDATFDHSRAFVFSTIFGIYLSARYSPKEQMHLLRWLLGIFVILNLIITLIFPSYGIDFAYLGGPAWRGITRHKNELSGSVSMISTFFITTSIYQQKSRWIYLSLTFISLLLLVLSLGKGSLSIFVGLLCILPLHKFTQQKYRLRTILLISFLAVVTFIAIFVAFNLEFLIVDLLGKDMGGNSRDQVWALLIEKGWERPWLGYGYAGFWNDIAKSSEVAVAFPWIHGAGEGGGNAHSSYVEIFLHLGWLGIFLMTISLVTVLARILLLHGLTKQIEYFGMIQFVLILACTSFYESYGGFLAYRHWFWVMYVSFAYSTAIQLHRIHRSKTKISMNRSILNFSEIISNYRITD